MLTSSQPPGLEWDWHSRPSISGPIIGSTFVELLPLLEEDLTKVIVLFCEPGTSLQAAVRVAKEVNYSKPIVTLTGRFVDACRACVSDTPP